MAALTVNGSAPGAGVADVARIAWPVAISMLSYVAMNVTDTLFVGQLGTEDLAAVGLAASQVFLAIMGFTGLLEGVRVGVAHATGAGRHADGRRLAWAGLAIADVAGALVATWAPFGEHIFAWLGASPAVAGKAASYFAWRIFAAPLLFVTVTLSCWFGGRGETQIPMRATLAGNATNILLDSILVFGLGPIPQLGIVGAGIASACGQAVACIVMVAAARPLWRKGLQRPRRSDLAAIVRVGAPIGVNHVLDVGAYVGLAALLAGAGDVQLAAHVVAARILSVSFMPGYAIGEAGGVLVGQALGGGSKAGARQALRSAMGLSVGAMAACGLLFAVLPALWLAPFRLAPDVFAVARDVLLLGAVMQLFDAVATSAMCALNGAGDTRFTLAWNVGSAWLVQVPIAMALCLWLDLGAVGVWLAMGAHLGLQALVFGLRVRGDRWLTRAPTA